MSHATRHVAMEDDGPHMHGRSMRKKFSPEEDEILVRMVEANGPHRWDEIAAAVPGRTGRQCRDRFRNYLMPNLNPEPWSPEEDEILVAKHYEIGPHWSRIAEFLPGRSSNSVKNRWYTYHQKSVRREVEGNLNKEATGIKHLPVTVTTARPERAKPRVHVFEKSGEPKSGNYLPQRLLDILIPPDEVTA